jgi:hypothetical protein
LNESNSEDQMADAWQFQVRISVSAKLAAILRGDLAATLHPALRDVLGRHHASLKCQLDAFADYVSKAEEQGPEKYPLYQWTRETIGVPEKKAKYLRSFTVYVEGRDVYQRETADLLQSELSALAGDAGLESVVKFDTNPANNPQPPEHRQ